MKDYEINCKILELARQVNSVPAEQQNEFFEKLKSFLEPKEVEALMFAVSYFGMLENPKKMKSVKKAMAEELYKKFNAR